MRSPKRSRQSTWRSATPPKERVLVVGAGPVGLLTTLALARGGVPVTIFEEEPALTTDLRAGSFHPPTLECMAPFGITARMLETAIQVPRWQIRDREHPEWIAEFDLSLLADVTPYPYRLHIEQHRLTPIIFDILAREPNAEIRFGHRFTELEQRHNVVRATFVHDERPVTVEGAWLIGADGGRSSVRKAAAIAFEGFTWPERFFVMSTTHDFAQHGYAMNAYVADPDQFIAIFKMPDDGPPGIWRLLYPTDPNLSDETIASADAIEAFLQGFVSIPGRYPMKYSSFYRIHQRVAQTFRSGRVVLAGDAAHINNPLGAFGLNSGIHDAINLSEKLTAVMRGEADDDLIDRYVRQRRTATVDHVQAMSIRNKHLLEERDPAVRKERFAELQRVASTPALARDYLLNSSMIASVRRAAAVA